jgi:hypothetical protein
MRGSHSFFSQADSSGKGPMACRPTPFQGFQRPDKTAQVGHFGLFFGLQLVTTESAKPSFYPLRNCWRVRIPASESEIGKREAAETFIAEHRKTGSIQLAELSVENSTCWV